MSSFSTLPPEHILECLKGIIRQCFSILLPLLRQRLRFKFCTSHFEHGYWDQIPEFRKGTLQQQPLSPIISLISPLSFLSFHLYTRQTVHGRNAPIHIIRIPIWRCPTFIPLCLFIYILPIHANTLVVQPSPWISRGDRLLYCHLLDPQTGPPGTDHSVPSIPHTYIKLTNALPPSIIGL